MLSVLRRGRRFDLGTFHTPDRGNRRSMLMIGMLLVGSLILGVLLAALLPGAGLFFGAAVVVLAIVGAIWLLLAGASGETPSEAVAETHEASLLGPGGPDDPR